jgi:hypothetical protein
MKRIPVTCPACGVGLRVKRLACEGCNTGIEGTFDLPLQARLPYEDQEFILAFVKASGSLKEMARLLGLSYPTVRNRLDDIIERCNALDVSHEAGGGGPSAEGQ